LSNLGKHLANRFAKSRTGKIVAIVGTTLGVALMPEMASAITAPTAPAAGAAAPLGYDIYDVAVNGILKGPIGFVTGIGTIVFGATQLMKSWPIALMSVLGGTAIIKADTIVSSLGMLV